MKVSNIIKNATLSHVSLVSSAQVTRLRGGGEATLVHPADEGGIIKELRSDRSDGRSLGNNFWEMHEGACRKWHGGKGKRGHDYIVDRSSKDFDTCQKSCKNSDDCKGFEYRHGRCELWNKYHGAAAVYKEGYKCYWKKPTEEEVGEEFVAQPSIFQEVLEEGDPCNVVNGGGAKFVRKGDDVNQVRLKLYEDEICLYSSVELVGTEMKYHIHGPAGLGENGGLLFDLTNTVELGAIEKEVCVGLDQNLLEKGSSSEEEEAAIETVKDAFRDGKLYVNIHTEECPGGEQRGQIVPLL